MRKSITIWIEDWEMKLWKIASGGEGKLSGWIRANCNGSIDPRMEISAEDRKELDEMAKAWQRTRHVAATKREHAKIPGAAEPLPDPHIPWKRREIPPEVPVVRIPIWKQGEMRKEVRHVEPEAVVEPVREERSGSEIPRAEKSRIEPEKPIRKPQEPRTRMIATHCAHNYILLPDGTTACPECKRMKRR
jgi:hypothetical protein